jgi:hypothetical protein
MKISKWLEDFQKELKNIVPDYDKRQKIIKLFNIVYKEKRKQWELKHKQEQSKLL